jgi:hypothetical protein
MVVGGLARSPSVLYAGPASIASLCGRRAGPAGAARRGTARNSRARLTELLNPHHPERSTSCRCAAQWEPERVHGFRSSRSAATSATRRLLDQGGKEGQEARREEDEGARSASGWGRRRAASRAIDPAAGVRHRDEQRSCLGGSPGMHTPLRMWVGATSDVSWSTRLPREK